MSSFVSILVSFVALLVRVSAGDVHPGVLCTNMTVPTSSTSLTPPPSIYTSPPNISVLPPIMHLYSFAASVDPYDWHAHYSFVWIIDPDFSVVECRASVAARHGNLSDVGVARCWQDKSWLEVHNYTVPPRFTFSWQNTRDNGTVLVLRSTNPASAHHCPDFPHDACWAQGLYWVPRRDIRRRRGGVQEYVGAGDVLVVGTYCKSGMPECAWSEYLY